jgi:hypothetical protein
MGTTGGGAAPYAGYANPFRSARVTPSRVDMGYDIVGHGPIYALGPGVITEADNAWRGAHGAPYPGTYIVERITEGPLKGRSIFTAEDVVPSVRVGQRVDMNTVIGHFTGAGSLETGYSYGTGGTTMAAHTGQSALGESEGDPGKYSTAYGVAFANVLEKLGAPHGTINPPVQGSVPKTFPGAGDVTGGDVQTTSFLGSLLGGLLGGSGAMDMLERVGLVIFGAFLVLVGVWLLAGKQTLRVATKTAMAVK